MRGTVRIGERDVDMVANGATPFIYKRIFRRDFLTTTQTDDMNVYTELAFVMSQQAVKPMSELLNNLTVDDFYAWVEGFGPWTLSTRQRRFSLSIKGRQTPHPRQKKRNKNRQTV